MRVSDYIAERLHQFGIRHVYGLVGGGTAGLNDGFISHPDIEFICFHHEQGAGHAAVGSARTNGKLAVVNVTTGCGGTNCLTSCLDAWQESMPVLFLSGNTRLDNIAAYINKQKGTSLRRYGLQEHDIVTTVQNLTKYAVMLENVDDVAYEIDKAIHIATSGRPGPVWIDVPGNIQTAKMPDSPRRYEPSATSEAIPVDAINSAINDLLLTAERPLIIAGAGISMSGSQAAFRTMIDMYKIPFVTTFLTRDLIPSGHPQNIGMIGIKGNRAANFAMQNADLLLILGSSMNVSHIGYDSKSFSPHSRKIMVDIDPSELQKGIIKVDAPVNTDVKHFINACLSRDLRLHIEPWISKTQHWKGKWPIYDPAVHRPDQGGVNLYEFVESLNRNLEALDALLVDAGQPGYICSTNLHVKDGVRYMIQAAQGDMGYAIPASVGTHFADPSLNIMMCIGEGSFYTNMQELAVIRQHRLPIKIFVINNDGYMSIKQTQTKFFGGRLHGVSKSTGVYFADLEKVAAAFEIPYHKIENNQELDELVPQIMHGNSPAIVEIMSQDTLDVLPAQAIKPDGTQGGLHDMAPFIDPKELDNEMVVKI